MMCLFKKDFIYLRGESKQARAGREAEGEGEADSPLSREPYSGLNLRTLAGIKTPAKGRCFMSDRAIGVLPNMKCLKWTKIF